MTSPRADQAQPGGMRTHAPGSRASAQEPGIAPGVPNTKTAFALDVVPTSGASFYTFPTTGRIWVASISFAVSTSAGFAGATPFYARLVTSTGLLLASVQLSLSSEPAAANGGDSNPWPGIYATAGETFLINVNGGTVVTGALIRADAYVAYSIP